MPLSISSSNKDQKKWLMTWFLVLIICATSLFAYELFLNKKGFVASIESNNDLWSWYRAKVDNNPNSLVFVGASRSQLDINIPYLKQRFKHHDVIQLSVNGHYPMATIKALADDVDFNGTLIVSLNAQALEPFYFDMQSPQNDYFEHKSSIYKSFDAYITAYIKSQFRFFHPLLGLKQIVEFYDKNTSFQSAFYTTANLDQSVSANYALTNTENLYNHFVNEKEKNYQEKPPTKPDQWMNNVDLLSQYIKAIESRGGNVVLIRFPTFKGHWELDEKYYPRSQYWNKISEQQDLKTLHFNDIKGMDQFESPDSSHLDQKDSEKFTQILFDELMNRQYLK